MLFRSPGPPVAGEGDEWERRLIGHWFTVLFIAGADSQKRGGRKRGGQIGETGGKGDRNEETGIAGG